MKLVLALVLVLLSSAADASPLSYALGCNDPLNGESKKDRDNVRRWRAARARAQAQARAQAWRPARKKGKRQAPRVPLVPVVYRGEVEGDR